MIARHPRIDRSPNPSGQRRLVGPRTLARVRESIGGRAVAVTLSAFTVLAVIGLAALEMPLLRGQPVAAPSSPVPTRRYYTCLDQPSADHPGDDPCPRIVADLRRRREITDAEGDGMLSTMASVTGALHRRTRSECQPNAGPCALVVLPADVTEVRGPQR